MQITGSLHRLGNGSVNSYLLEDRGEITIVDAGVAAIGASSRASLPKWVGRWTTYEPSS
jgi:hypothetical protein